MEIDVDIMSDVCQYSAMALIECPRCGTKLLHLGKVHSCKGAANSSGGGASALGAIGKRITEQLPCRDEARAEGKNLAPSGVTATLAVPPETKSKRGRPRIGEPKPEQPWIAAGMSERTWYRRQKEAK